MFSAFLNYPAGINQPKKGAVAKDKILPQPFFIGFRFLFFSFLFKFYVYSVYIPKCRLSRLYGKNRNRTANFKECFNFFYQPPSSHSRGIDAPSSPTPLTVTILSLHAKITMLISGFS